MRCRGSWKNNGEILSSGLLEDWQIPRFSPDEIVRFNGYGELINATHLLNIFNICNTNPDVQFALWTKRFRIVQQHLDQKPANLILIHSNPYLDQTSILPRGFDKTFNVKTVSSSQINCSRSCLKCLICYDPTNKAAVINELLK